MLAQNGQFMKVHKAHFQIEIAKIESKHPIYHSNCSLLKHLFMPAGGGFDFYPPDNIVALPWLHVGQKLNNCQDAIKHLHINIYHNKNKHGRCPNDFIKEVT